VFHGDLPGLTARDGRSGARLWRRSDPGEESCADELIDLRLEGGRLLALLACHRSEEAAGFAEARTSRASLLALDAATGKRRWAVHGEIPAPLASLAGRVFLALDGRPTALDASTGRIAWRTETFGELSQGPSAGDGRVVFQAEEGQVRAFDATRGRQLWSVALPGVARAPAAVSAGAIVVVRLLRGEGPPVDQPHTSLIAGLDPATGTVRWRRELAGELAFSAPEATGGLTFLLTEGARGPGRLRALAPATGAEVWAQAVDCGLSHDCTPTLGPGGLLGWSARAPGSSDCPPDDELWLELRAPTTGLLLAEFRVRGQEKLGASRPVLGRGFLVLSLGEELRGYRPRGAWR
jgi:outer membrane protein assembly factor BamB